MSFLCIQSARDLPSFNQHSMVSLSINGGEDMTEILTRFNNQPFHTPPLALAIADMALVRAFTGNKNLSISTSNHPLPRTDIEKVMEDLSQCVSRYTKTQVKTSDIYLFHSNIIKASKL